MAIFIIDQFSLNTDLPLDIRYLPTAGRLDPDISVYKYPGMQVYDTSTDGLWYCDNSLNWVEVGGDADASLNALWDYVIDLSTSITNIDGSIGDIWNVLDIHEASIGDIYNILDIHDASIGDLTARVISLEGSVGYLTDWNLTQDVSIENLRTDFNQLEASIVRIDGDISQIEASIARIDDVNDQQDASIIRIDGDITDINAYQVIQDLSIAYNDSSIVQLFGLIPDVDASLQELYEYNVIQDASISTNSTDIINIETSLGVLNNWNISQDASIVAIESSLGDYVRKDGDTMTGPLTITGGGLQVGSIGTPLDVSIYSDLYVHNDTFIGGNLTVDGSLYITNVETIDVSAAFIHLNTGLTGTPPPTMQSGIVVGRGDEDPYVFLFDESTQDFRIGVAIETSTGYLDASTQAVATREDNPIDTALAFWNNALDRFDTNSGLTFTSTNGLDLDLSLNLSALAGGSNLMLVVQPDGYVVAQIISSADASLNDLYAYIDGSLAERDSSIAQNASDIVLNQIQIAQLDASIVRTDAYQVIQDASITANTNNITIIDGSITYLTNLVNIHEASIGDLYIITDQLDASIIRIDASVTELYSLIGDTSVKGAINIGDGSAQVYAGLTADGSLQFREFVGANGVNVLQTGDLISIEIDASFSGGEINTASNIGTGEGLAATKEGVDLPFKSLEATDPTELIITSDASTIYFDVSIAAGSTDASLVGLTDTSLNETEFVDHTNMEWDSVVGKWINTNNLWWDTSLATTTDDLGGIPAGTNLLGDNLKEILYKILYEYQVPTLSTFTVPTSGIYEKGLVSTQFAEVSINWTTTNANYPLALLNNVHISKTGVGSIFDASLGLVASDTSVYTDLTGITNWGGTSRTISYGVTIDDDQSDQSQPAVGSSESFSFYYRQWWGMVDGNTNANAVDSAMIKGLIDSRLAGESDLNATFDNSTGGFVKYLFAYPDTVAAPDNFGTLSQILDQNDFDITGSWDTENEDVSIGVNDIRYRFYLLKNKVDTSIFDITFKF